MGKNRRKTADGARPPPGMAYTRKWCAGSSGMLQRADAGNMEMASLCLPGAAA